MRVLFVAAFVSAGVLLVAAATAHAQEGRAGGSSPEEIKAAIQRAREEQQQQEQTPKPATAQSHPNNPELWNVEQMMEDAVLQISRRYNLNPAQEEYTRLLLTSRVRAFLDQHEKDVRELLRESIDMRLGIKPGTPDAYKRWAERAAPIYTAAQQAILDGNEEWGAILDETQKKTHDADLSAMRTSFDQVGRMLENWKSGQGPVGFNFAQQQAKPGQGQQGLGGGPVTQARVSNPQPPVVQQQVEDTWQAYVNRFIRTYGLDEKQAISARDKIYKDIRDQANQYREKHKAEFASISAETYAQKPKVDLKEIDRRRKELERPLGEMFVTLDRRLRTLPDAKQIASADAKQVEQLNAMFKLLAGELGVTDKEDGKSAPTVDQKPASTGDGAAKPKEAEGKKTDTPSEAEPKPAEAKPGEPAPEGSPPGKKAA